MRLSDIPAVCTPRRVGSGARKTRTGSTTSAVLSGQSTNGAERFDKPSPARHLAVLEPVSGESKTG
jgi:hypothetical protein